MTDRASDAPVLTRREGAAGRITLNRPHALHALTLEMCERMIEALLAWRADPEIELVVLDHAGERGFCAGGDIRMLAESGAGDGAEARAFFRREYQLNHLLMTYPKPTLAVMDGVVMGGGVGLSLPCRRRAATERTAFAMPETGIGLFPDVGGGWHLPRLPGRTGMWLALTGARVRGGDLLDLGIATDFLASGEAAALVSAACASPQSVDARLAAAAATPPASTLSPVREVIDRCFGLPSVEGILAALEEEGSAFAREQAAILRTKSPQTLKVAHRQLTLGAEAKDFADEMRTEFRIAARVVARHDFLEGVRAVIIDKDNAPRWRPERLEAVGEDLLDAIFAPLPPEEEWRPLEFTP